MINPLNDQSQWIVDLRAATDRGLGGKARNLSILAKKGFPVPPAQVLTGAAHRFFRGRPDAPPPCQDTLDPLLEQAIESVTGDRYDQVMIRSSASNEDGKQKSFAGIFESYRCSADTGSVRRAVEACWNSLDSERANAYRGGPRDPDDYMAVLIQARVPARYAGVAFTRDPTSGQESALIEIVAGDPASLVDGTAQAARFRLDRNVENLTVQDFSSTDDSIPRDLLRRVLDLALATEEALGSPQDVEWVMDPEDKVWVVQSRPISTLATQGGNYRTAPPEGYKRAHEEKFTPFGTWLEEEKAPRYEKAARRVKGPFYRWKVQFIDNRFHVLESSTRADKLWELALIPIWILESDELLRDYYAAERRYRHRVDSLERRCMTAPGLPDSISGLEKLVEAYLRFASDESLMAGHLANLHAGLLSRICRILDPSSTIGAHDLLLGVNTVTHDRDLALWDISREGNDQAAKLAAWERQYGYVFADRNAKDPGWQTDKKRRTTIIRELKRSPASLSPARRLDQAIARAQAAHRHFVQRIQAFPRHRARLPPLIFEHLLRRARETFPLREQRNHEFYGGVMAIGRVLRALGNRLRPRGLTNASDIFFLSLPEILRFGHESDFKILAATARRRSMAEVLVRPMTGDVAVAPHTREVFRGIPASKGRADGPARVVDTWDHAQDLKSGEILVCRALRPYLTPLMLVAAGLVTETGSVLSHGANLAREYGIPAVLGVDGAGSEIATGDLVRIDGDTGEITVLKRAS